MSGFGRAVVIPGEAPETDDEEEEVNCVVAPLSQDGSQRVQNSEPSQLRSLPVRSVSDFYLHQRDSEHSSKYKSLSHKKLQEVHVNLAVEASLFVNGHYSTLTKELGQVHSATDSIQSATQDASAKIRRVAEDLYKIDDQLDAILSQTVLPDLSDMSTFPCLKHWVDKSRET